MDFQLKQGQQSQFTPSQTGVSFHWVNALFTPPGALAEGSIKKFTADQFMCPEWMRDNCHDTFQTTMQPIGLSLLFIY